MYGYKLAFNSENLVWQVILNRFPKKNEVPLETVHCVFSQACFYFPFLASNMFFFLTLLPVLIIVSQFFCPFDVFCKIVTS